RLQIAITLQYSAEIAKCNNIANPLRSAWSAVVLQKPSGRSRATAPTEWGEYGKIEYTWIAESLLRPLANHIIKFILCYAILTALINTAPKI
ncbi:MAG: hypothetical protein RR349_06540, partial [Oscillospiraceae bacterium]